MHFADYLLKDACPPHRFLEEMTQSIPWKRFENLLNQHLPTKKAGSPPTPRSFFLKCTYSNCGFSLSDVQA